MNKDGHRSFSSVQAGETFNIFAIVEDLYNDIKKCNLDWSLTFILKDKNKELVSATLFFTNDCVQHYRLIGKGTLLLFKGLYCYSYRDKIYVKGRIKQDGGDCQVYIFPSDVDMSHPTPLELHNGRPSVNYVASKEDIKLIHSFLNDDSLTTVQSIQMEAVKGTYVDLIARLDHIMLRQDGKMINLNVWDGTGDCIMWDEDVSEITVRNTVQVNSWEASHIKTFTETPLGTWLLFTGLRVNIYRDKKELMLQRTSTIRPLALGDARVVQRLRRHLTILEEHSSIHER
ncbi:hypothetical protein SAMD00019534_031580, partial [Acytostelium subglobosum LB1]|uniref:hypothetical protein n=1 Tax=Acytostelium subglobosum LB1 TaxID=1410327 RepID=UPI0006449DF4